MFADEFLQVALICPLSHNDELIVMDKGVDVLDNVGMVESLHQIDLLETFFALFLICHVENLSQHKCTLIFLSAKDTPC